MRRSIWGRGVAVVVVVVGGEVDGGVGVGVVLGGGTGGCMGRLLDGAMAAGFVKVW